MAGANPVLTQSDIIFNTDNYYIYGSVMVSGQGNAAFGMTISGPSTNPGMAVTELLAGAPVPATYTFTFWNGNAPYYPVYDTGSPLRWGDYSFTSLDPCDDMTLWTIQEYAYNSGQWGVRVATVSAAPPLPNSVTPYQVPKGTLAIPVALFGNGFFDSSALDACHQNLKVSVYGVNGSLAISDLRLLDSGHISFNLNTCGASLSASAAVTNPDGQTGSRDGVVVISGPSSYCPPDTIGVYRPSTATFYLRNYNTTGFADITIPFNYAQPYPVVGDWTGNGVTNTIGIYDQGNGVFSLRNSNTPCPPDEQLVLGYPNDQPIAGRWQVNPPIPAVSHRSVPSILVPTTPIPVSSAVPNLGLGD